MGILEYIDKRDGDVTVTFCGYNKVGWYIASICVASLYLRKGFFRLRSHSVDNVFEVSLSEILNYDDKNLEALDAMGIWCFIESVIFSETLNFEDIWKILIRLIFCVLLSP